MKGICTEKSDLYLKWLPRKSRFLLNLTDGRTFVILSSFGTKNTYKEKPKIKLIDMVVLN